MPTAKSVCGHSRARPEVPINPVGGVPLLPDELWAYVVTIGCTETTLLYADGQNTREHKQCLVRHVLAARRLSTCCRDAVESMFVYIGPPRNLVNKLKLDVLASENMNTFRPHFFWVWNVVYVRTAHHSWYQYNETKAYETFVETVRLVFDERQRLSRTSPTPSGTVELLDRRLCKIFKSMDEAIIGYGVRANKINGVRVNVIDAPKKTLAFLLSE